MNGQIELLNTLRKRGVCDITALSHCLGTSTKAVEIKLGKLKKMGLIESIAVTKWHNEDNQHYKTKVFKAKEVEQ